MVFSRKFFGSFSTKKKNEKKIEVVYKMDVTAKMQLIVRIPDGYLSFRVQFIFTTCVSINLRRKNYTKNFEFRYTVVIYANETTKAIINLHIRTSAACLPNSV